MRNLIIAGAGGFIGGHLVKRLLQTTDTIKILAVDLKPKNKWFQNFKDKRLKNIYDTNLRDRNKCDQIVEKGYDVLINLASDHGGIGHIMNNHLECMKDVMINTNLIEIAVEKKIDKYLFSSSACVYNTSFQENSIINPLEESQAYPAQPDSQYGWEKLFSEQLCTLYFERHGIDVKLPRIHGCFGPYNHFRDGKEKAPNALARKVIEAKNSKKYQIEIWGDGKQTRSFMYIDDCIDGLLKILNSDFNKPINLGNSELVSINHCVSVLEKRAGVKLERKYNLNATQGVRGRNSDNTLIKKIINWEPKMKVEDSFPSLYNFLLEKING